MLSRSSRPFRGLEARRIQPASGLQPPGGGYRGGVWTGWLKAVELSLYRSLRKPIVPLRRVGRLNPNNMVKCPLLGGLDVRERGEWRKKNQIPYGNGSERWGSEVLFGTE